MSSLPLWSYGGILLGSLLLSLVLTPVALRVALRLNVLDHPGPAKAHGEAVPYLGGAAIVVSFAAVVLMATVLRPPPSGLPQLAGFLGFGVALALVGLADDIRGGLSPWLRLALEAAVGVAIWSMGDVTHLAGVPRPLDAVITVAWVVGVTNAFNLLDNMDGLSAGVAAVAALAIFGIAALQHRYLVAALAVALAGCAAGFLRANFHPAKIYMGDAGSLFLGFVLAVLLLKLRGERADPGSRGRDPDGARGGVVRHDPRDVVTGGAPAEPVERRAGPHQPPARAPWLVRPQSRGDHLRGCSRARRRCCGDVEVGLSFPYHRRRRVARRGGAGSCAAGPGACLP